MRMNLAEGFYYPLSYPQLNWKKFLSMCEGMEKNSGFCSVPTLQPQNKSMQSLIKHLKKITTVMVFLYFHIITPASSKNTYFPLSEIFFTWTSWIAFPKIKLSILCKRERERERERERDGLRGNTDILLSSISGP